MLQDMCNDIELITGIKAVIYDTDNKILHAQPDNMCDFCQEIRRSPELTARCLQCDREGMARCRASKQIEIYQCHMGLTEVFAPILDNGVVIGHILFGQLLTPDARAQVLSQIENTMHVDRDVLRQALASMPETPMTIIEASARLMAMCACYAQLTALLSVRQNNLAVHIEQYLSQHLADKDLNIHTVCRHFGISRGTLYTISQNAFGMGLSQYIRQLRLQRAIELLPRGGSITTIAENVGFSDPAYMSKLIRQKTGQTPKKMQKSTTQRNKNGINGKSSK